MDKHDYGVVAEYITQEFIKTVSGENIDDIFVDANPAERVMVGMLAENRIDQTFSGDYVENNATRFESIPSLRISFLISKGHGASIRIVPRGLLFYSIEPNYEKTKEYIIQKYSEKDNHPYQTIDELCSVYPEEKFLLPLTYKKIDLEQVFGDGITVDVDTLSDGDIHLEGELNQTLASIADAVSSEIKITKSTHIGFADLLTEDNFFISTTTSNEIVQVRWCIDVLCSIVNDGNIVHVTLQMVNKTPVPDRKSLGYLPKIFNAGLRIHGDNNTVFNRIDLDVIASSYKEKDEVYAVTENTAYVYDKDTNTLSTDNVPKYVQKRLKTNDQYSDYVSFDALITQPIENLKTILTFMLSDYEKCKAEYRQTVSISDSARHKFEEALDEYGNEIQRFKKGIDQIQYKDYVRRAFELMNRTFQLRLDGEHRDIRGWRLFQIVFIISLIPEMIRSEYKEDASLVDADLDIANLLYFPTGGGKTEAFLGACVFAMFFDRLRGKNDGITSILKYPLRLLAVQQLDRVLSVVIKANIIRERTSEIEFSTPFRVGFYVGKNNTPNRIDEREPLSDRGEYPGPRNLILESDQDTLNEWYRFIDTCPVCGKKETNVRFDREHWVLLHYCDNPECSMNAFPLLIVDSEIYRYLPSIVVSTIDKMAMLGTTNEFKSLLGQVKTRCRVHGFSIGKNCSCSTCRNASLMRAVEHLKDPIPTLFIQDELHLVKESLGTFDAHYESFINYYARELVPDYQQKQIRFIGATATISKYREHIQNLYHKNARRFPCEYPSVSVGKDFYSFTDDKDTTRIIVGYAPYGRSITDGMWQSVYVMRVITGIMMRDYEQVYAKIVEKGFTGSLEDFKQCLFDYWIELVYNNRKQDAMELENAFQNQANNILEVKGIPKFAIKQMTSDVDFQEVRKALFDIQANHTNVEQTNLLLATSTISHGVDEDSFNIMYFFGMPNNNAEYIQAYSRVGRKYTGIVIDIIRLLRIRDRSYLKNFVIFHQNKDALVEAVPINRWAKNAIYSTLPGLLSGMLMQYYTIKTDTHDFYHAVTVKKLLQDGQIAAEEVAEHIVSMLGCNEQEKMSIAYADIIRTEVASILSGIQNGNFTSSDFLSNAIAKFSKWYKKPMTSLRDTEEQIEIKVSR